MELLFTPVFAVLLVHQVVRRFLRRTAARPASVLLEVEAAAPAVIADWPAAHCYKLAEILARERVARSFAYRQGLHTAESRQMNYALLQRIGAAETRLRTARHLASQARLPDRDHV
jgi:hypothetical protein